MPPVAENPAKIGPNRSRTPGFRKGELASRSERSQLSFFAPGKPRSLSRSERRQSTERPCLGLSAFCAKAVVDVAGLPQFVDVDPLIDRMGLVDRARSENDGGNAGGGD